MGHTGIGPMDRPHSDSTLIPQIPNLSLRTPLTLMPPHGHSNNSHTVTVKQPLDILMPAPYIDALGAKATSSKNGLRKSLNIDWVAGEMDLETEELGSNQTGMLSQE